MTYTEKQGKGWEMTVLQEMQNTTKSKAKGNSIYSEGRGLAFESRRVHQLFSIG